MNILILTNAWGSGGIETNFINILKNFHNNDKYNFHISTFKYLSNIFEERLFKYCTSFTYYYDGRTLDRRIKLTEQLKYLKLISNGNYDIIHINNSSGMGFVYAHTIKKYNKKVKVILHGHGDGIGGRFKFIKKIIYPMLRKMYEKDIDFAIGCSEQIKKWLFSNKMCSSNKCKTIKYSIDVDQFQFNMGNRVDMRKKLCIPDSCFLIGTIGRIDEQKNPYFILEVIKKFCEDFFNDFKFLWIGKGSWENDVIKKAREMQIDDKIIFAGTTNQVSEMLSAMDIFILPSLYEGLAIVLIEAQASGLYVYASDSITKEAKASDKIDFLPINEGFNIWSERIIEKLKNYKINPNERETAVNCVKEYGWDSIKNSYELKLIYDSLIKREDKFKKRIV